MKYLLVLLASLQCLQATSLLTRSGNHFIDSAGNAKLLAGGHVWPSTAALNGAPADYTWSNWVDLNTSTNWTFQRMWIFDELLYSHGPVNEIPFQRTGPGNAADGGLKVNLSLYEASFFTQLSNRVAALDAKGIYASVMFFQGVRVNGNTNSWLTNIWYSPNNVNGVLSLRTDVYTANNSTHYGLCTNYVRKVVQTLNGFNNVLWEIGNEMPYQSAAFQSNIVLMIKAYELTLPKQHLVGMTSFDYPSWGVDSINSNLYLDSSPADYISYIGVGTTPPGTSELWLTNPPAYTSSAHVSILDTDHIVGGTPTDSAKALSWPWRAFTRGHNPINQDYPGSGYFDLTPNQSMRQVIGHVVRYANRVKMLTMVPSTTMASTGFILTNTLNQQLAYQPDANNFTTKLPAGRYYYEKWNTTTGAGGIQNSGYVYQPTSGDFTWVHPGNGFLLFCEPARLAGGIDFDGVDDLVNCGSGSTLDDISQTTWMGWMYMRSGYLLNGRIVAKESAAGDGTGCIFVGDTSGPRVMWAKKFSGALGIWHSPVISSNTWYHVAVTYNDASAANDPLIYINGVSQTVTELATPSGTRNTDATYDLTIGASGNGSQPFDGLIQDVRVYNRILTTAEILAIYNSRSHNFPIMSGLKGYWPLNDGADGTIANGATARDRSGNGNNGTGDDGANNAGLIWRSGSLTH
jgi:hypothetical protein